MTLQRLALLGALVAAAALSAEPITSKSQHPEAWAQPITQQGLPNLHKVSDRLYRSAQPLPPGYPDLKKLGIKTIICLRNDNTDLEYAPENGLKVVHIGMRTWKPTEDQVVEFLKTATYPENQPVLVHCKHGADRTGLMCAVYRIAVDGWSKQDAIEEMTEGDFGFHSVWQNLVRFIKKLDVEKVKKEAGLA
jgi:protein tyrosine/serine phosphatase